MLGGSTVVLCMWCAILSAAGHVCCANLQCSPQGIPAAANPQHAVLGLGLEITVAKASLPEAGYGHHVAHAKLHTLLAL